MSKNRKEDQDDTSPESPVSSFPVNIRCERNINGGYHFIGNRGAPGDSRSLSSFPRGYGSIVEGNESFISVAQEIAEFFEDANLFTLEIDALEKRELFIKTLKRVFQEKGRSVELCPISHNE